VQSNHACLTAAAARRLGLQPVLLLTGQAPEVPEGNLYLDRIFGADVRIEPEPDDDWAQAVFAELEDRGARPYSVPYGGSNEIGVLGYVAAARELSAQCREKGVELASVVTASSSGGTQAGLVLAGANGWLDAPVVGVCAQDSASELAQRVERLAGLAAAEVDSTPPERSAVVTDDRFLGPGYAAVTEALVEAMELLARTEGILTDPVYTAKALSGLVAMVREGRWRREDHILFWHTGGIGGLFGSPPRARTTGHRTGPPPCGAV